MFIEGAQLAKAVFSGALIWLSSLNLNFNKLQYTVLIAYEKQVSYNNPVQIIFGIDYLPS